MARFGKGKPMDVQARLYLHKRLDLHSRHAEKQAKNVRGSQTTGKIHSLRTFNNYCASLTAAGQWLRQEYELRHLSNMTPEQGQTYLEHRAADGISQRQLDTDRTTLQFVTGQGTLDRLVLPDSANAHPTGRSYTPEQVRLLPIADRHVPYCKLVVERLKKAGLRVHLDGRGEKIGYKVREAEMQKVPYALVVGDREEASSKAALRVRSEGDRGAVDLDEFLSMAIEGVKSRSLTL